MPGSSVDRFLDQLNRIVAIVAMVAFIGMLLSTGSQVLFRYVLQISVGWTEELARVLFILSMFLGIAIAIREKEHIVVDFLFKKLPGRLRGIAGLVFNLAILAFLAGLMRGAAKMALVTWESSLIAMTWLMNGWLYFGECIAIGLMMVFVLAETAKSLELARKGDVSNEGASQ